MPCFLNKKRSKIHCSVELHIECLSCYMFVQVNDKPRFLAEHKNSV